MKPTLIIMVGLPASGKSSIARNLANKYDAIIVSSDAIRKEILGDENEQKYQDKVFGTFHYRIKSLLKKNKNIIVDAINVKRSDRKKLLKNIKDIDCFKIAYIVAKPIEQCLIDNANRERVVPQHAYIKMIDCFLLPTFEEGFQKIAYHPNKEHLEECLKGYQKYYKEHIQEYIEYKKQLKEEKEYELEC